MIVANWKCNGSKAMINEWTNNFLSNYVEMKKAFIGIAPPSIYIESILETKLSKLKEINIGSQDIDISSGARTGAISSEMILDFDCKFSIIGHSERRQFFNEGTELFNKGGNMFYSRRVQDELINATKISGRNKNGNGRRQMRL